MLSGSCLNVGRPLRTSDSTACNEHGPNTNSVGDTSPRDRPLDDESTDEAADDGRSDTPADELVVDRPGDESVNADDESVVDRVDEEAKGSE